MILYFSGTGNSKYVAKRIADALGDALVNLNDRIKASDTSLVETGERVKAICLSCFSILPVLQSCRKYHSLFCLRKR